MAEDTTERIAAVIQNYPDGLTISEISRKTRMHRTVITRYLESMVILGRLRLVSQGRSKIFSISHRVPVSELVSLRNDIVVIIDESGRVLQVNDAYLDFCNLLTDQVTGSGIFGSRLPFISDPVITRMLRQEGAPKTFERILADPVTGHKRFFRVRVTPSLLDHGHPGLVLIAIEIPQKTRQKKLPDGNNGVKESNGNGSTILVARFLPDWTVTYVNPAMCDYLGIPYNNVIGRDLLSIGPVEYQDLRTFDLSSVNGEHSAISVERKIVDREGRDRWDHWTLCALPDSSGSVMGFQLSGYEISRDVVAGGEQDTGGHPGQEIVSYVPAGFSETGKMEDIFPFIAKRVHLLTPSSIVTICSYDTGSKTWTVRYLAGNEEDIRYLGDIAGENVIGKEVPLSNQPDIMMVLLQKKLLEGPSLYDTLGKHLAGGDLPPAGSEHFFGKAYRMGLISKNEVVGHVTIQMNKDQVLVNMEAIELFINHMARECETMHSYN